MPHPLTDTPVYIVGAAETPLGKVLDQSEFSMVALAAAEALAEAGLGFKDVDALFTNYMGEEGSVQLGEYLGLQPRYAESSDMGGASFEFFVHHAMAAVATGRCEVALIAYASRQRSRKSRKKAAAALDGSLSAQFETPYGIHFPIGHYALSAARYMHQYGATPEHLAEVAVAARQWAALNPEGMGARSADDRRRAWRRRCSRDPLRKLDCCLVTDGGGAIVVARKDTGARRRQAAGPGARRRREPCPMAHRPMSRSDGDAGGRVGARRLRHGGHPPADVDVFEPYDNFTHAVLLYLEDLGFCEKGEAGASSPKAGCARAAACPA